MFFFFQICFSVCVCFCFGVVKKRGAAHGAIRCDALKNSAICNFVFGSGAGCTQRSQPKQSSSQQQQLVDEREKARE